MKEERIIHFVCKTHMDLGFTDYAEKVVDLYLHDFIPRAISLAEQCRQKPEGPQFTWTTGSWMIWRHLQQADSADRIKMESAIRDGLIFWHALPFTMHSELADSELFREGLSIAEELDARFGKKTIAAKMTDVPGHTIGIVPLLADAGIEYLHIGVNEASRLADLPEFFRWKSPDGREVPVSYVSGYGGISWAPGNKDGLYIMHTHDNLGPPTYGELCSEYETLKSAYPEYTVKASNLNAFTETLRGRTAALPEVTAEIGDTWIHGAGSDPGKTAGFRALRRVLREHPSDEREADRRLLLVPEHTWGMDLKTYLPDFKSYSHQDFTQALKKDAFTAPVVSKNPDCKTGTFSYSSFAKSWDEQRAYLESARAAIKNPQLSVKIEEELETLKPKLPDFSDYESLTPGSIKAESFIIDFCPDTGAVSRLDVNGDTPLLRDGGLFGLFYYEVYSAVEYGNFRKKYNGNMGENEWWGVPDFSKPGLETLKNHRYKRFKPQLQDLFKREASGVLELIVKAGMPDEAVNEYGAPETVITCYRFNAEQCDLDVSIQWFNKTACRIPEASWVSFDLQLNEPEKLLMNKLGLWLPPKSVVSGGNRALHALDRGIIYEGAPSFRLDTLDAPLFSPGHPHILDFLTEQPDAAKGLYFNLHNNLWGTNFPMWYDYDGLFRFRLSL